MEWLKRQNWLLIEERSNTGQQLRTWMRRQGWRIEPTMQLRQLLDLIINLVALGMGISFVPIRGVAPYNQETKKLLPNSTPGQICEGTRCGRSQTS